MVKDSIRHQAPPVKCKILGSCSHAQRGLYTVFAPFRLIHTITRRMLHEVAGYDWPCRFAWRCKTHFVMQALLWASELIHRREDRDDVEPIILLRSSKPQ